MGKAPRGGELNFEKQQEMVMIANLIKCFVPGMVLSLDGSELI